MARACTTVFAAAFQHLIQLASGFCSMYSSIFTSGFDAAISILLIHITIIQDLIVWVKKPPPVTFVLGNAKVEPRFHAPIKMQYCCCLEVFQIDSIVIAQTGQDPTILESIH